MSASADRVDNSLATDTRFREQRMSNEPLSAPNAVIKRFQSRRFKILKAAFDAFQTMRSTGEFLKQIAIRGP